MKITKYDVYNLKKENVVLFWDIETTKKAVVCGGTEISTRLYDFDVDVEFRINHKEYEDFGDYLQFGCYKIAKYENVKKLIKIQVEYLGEKIKVAYRNLEHLRLERAMRWGTISDKYRGDLEAVEASFPDRWKINISKI